jgi:hypothetical protein
MGLSEFYGPPMEQGAAIKLLHEALELGVEHFDTAEMYGIGGANDILLGEAFANRRDRVFIATKFGPTRDFKTGALPPSSDRHGISKPVSLLVSMVRVKTAGAPLKVHYSGCVPKLSICITCIVSIRLHRLRKRWPLWRNWWPKARCAP